MRCDKRVFIRWSYCREWKRTWTWKSSIDGVRWWSWAMCVWNDMRRRLVCLRICIILICIFIYLYACSSLFFNSESVWMIEELVCVLGASSDLWDADGSFFCACALLFEIISLSESWQFQHNNCTSDWVVKKEAWVFFIQIHKKALWIEEITATKTIYLSAITAHHDAAYSWARRSALVPGSAYLIHCTLDVNVFPRKWISTNNVANW